jgi:tetratricopeptide (TPR) repeat protein
VRISIQLIDARTQEHLWAKAYDRTIENVFAIQADIAEQTAGAFKVEFLGSEREAIQERPTPNPAAYESYLRGIQAFQQSTGFGGEEIDKKAVKYFEDAIREDPQFSGAYSYLANHLIAVMGNTRPGREVFPRARELVAKALELNPNSSDAHTAQGNLAMQMDHDWTRAEMEFREAISLNPSGSTSHFWYGYLLGVLQRFDEAKEQYLKAIELDPLWLLPRLNLAGTYVSSGEVASAIALYEKLEASYPESPMIHMTRAGILALAGQVDDAIRAVELLKDLPDPMSRMIRAGVLAFAGMPEEARELLSEWKEKGQPMYLPAMGAATLYALSGDKETALDLLENDYRDGDRTLWTSYHSQAFDEIRGDPRFVAMIQAMHLPTKTPPHQPKILKRTSG